MSPYHRIPLAKGDRVRLESPTSPVLEVIRVSPSAAYVKGGAPREVTIRTGYVDGEPVERTFTAESSIVLAISRNSAVWEE
jgi:hypothetical protein